MVRNLGKKLKNMGEIKQGGQHPEKKKEVVGMKESSQFIHIIISREHHQQKKVSRGMNF